MRFNILKSFSVVAAGLLLITCQKKIKLKESEITPRIVVNSIFEAEDTLKVHLSESRNILFNNGGELPDITSATATLTDANDATLGTFIHEGKGVYSLPGFLPKSGTEYRLKVSANGFADVSSSNSIPDPIKITSIDTARQQDYMNFNVVFKDNPNEKNYYALSVVSKVIYEYEIEPGVFETDTILDWWVCSKDVNIQGIAADVDGDICGQELLFDDETFNGSGYNFKLRKYMEGEIDTIFVSLRSISEDLFKYKISYQKYVDTKENPFGEPVQVFSNIKNGFGIFAGSSLHTETIVIE